MGVKHIQGEVRINDDKVVTQKQVKEDFFDQFNAEFEKNNSIISQSNFYNINNNTAVYDYRETAGGLNILDGGKAVLKKVKGNTIKSNNLIPYPYHTGSKENEDGSKLIVQTDGGITGSGTPTNYISVTLVYRFKVTTDLTFSLYGNNASGIIAGIAFLKTDFSLITSLTAYPNGTSIKISKDEYPELEYIVIEVKRNNNNQAMSGTVYPMLNEGSTALPYERYFKGLKSSSFEGVKSCGRNLFDPSKMTTFGFEKVDDNEYFVKNPATPYRYQQNNKEYLWENNGYEGQITISYDVKYVNTIDSNTIVGLFLRFEYTDGTVEHVYNRATFEKWQSVKSTTALGKIAKRVFITYGTGSVSTYIKNIMLEYGTVATGFAPYIQNTFDFPNTSTHMGTEIDFENQKIIEGSEEIVFNGTEDWTIQSVNANGVYNYMYKKYFAAKNEGAGICNLLKIDPSVIANATEEGVFIAKQALYIRSKSYTTVEDFKDHLAELADPNGTNNPLIVRYLLATPKEREFTAEEKAASNQYLSWRNGTEYVIGNDNAEYGVYNTITTDYTVMNSIPAEGATVTREYADNNFVAKEDSAFGGNQIYTKTAAGQSEMTLVSQYIDKDSIAQYNTNKQLLVTDPVDSRAITSKQYVDKTFAAVKQDIDIVNTALMQSKILYTADIEDAYNQRITAGGENVLDGSEAVLKKVVGDTVRCENLLNVPENFTFNKPYTITSEIYLPAGDYTISYSDDYTTEGTSSIVLAIRKTGKSYVYHIGASEKTQFIEEGIYYFQLFSNGYDYNASVGVTATVNKLMLNEGTTPLPYQPYFTGLKSASFAGIESGGRNLFNKNDKDIADGYFADGGEGVPNGTTAYNQKCSGWIAVMPNTTYIQNFANVNNQYAFYDKNKKWIKTTSYGGISESRTATFTTTADTYFVRIIYFQKYADALYLVVGTEEKPFTPYIEPSVFNFPKTEVGKWDTIDFELKKISRRTQTLTFDGSSDEHWHLIDKSEGEYPYMWIKLGDENYVVSDASVADRYYSNPSISVKNTELGYRVVNSTAYHESRLIARPYLEGLTDEAWRAELQANPLTVSFEITIPTETPFTEAQEAAGSKYLVWKNGTEKVIENREDNLEINNTLVQKYVLVSQ